MQHWKGNFSVIFSLLDFNWKCRFGLNAKNQIRKLELRNLLLNFIWGIIDETLLEFWWKTNKKVLFFNRFCGVIDTKRIGLITSIERIVEYVFMQALAYPNPETEDDDFSCSLVKTQLLPSLRSFCSALRVCEQVCTHFNVFDDGKLMFEKIDSQTEVQELAKNREFCEELEERVLHWIKAVAKVSSLSWHWEKRGLW